MKVVKNAISNHKIKVHDEDWVDVTDEAESFVPQTKPPNISNEDILIKTAENAKSDSQHTNAAILSNVLGTRLEKSGIIAWSSELFIRTFRSQQSPENSQPDG